MKVFFRVEIGNIGKSGRVEIRTETFGNYFLMADEIDVTTEPSFRENVDYIAIRNAKLLEMEGRR